MSAARISLAVFFGLLLLTPAAGVGPPPGPLLSDIARWVEELGDDNFRVRRAAAARLRAAGEAAEPALEEAAKSTDAEVSDKARRVLEDFRWGIYPDTPAKVIELVKKYRGNTDRFAHTRRDAVKDLLLLGTPGARAVYKFTRAEARGVPRTRLFADVASTFTHAMPLLVEADRLDLAERILEAGAREGDRRCMAHYAAVLTMRGGLARRAAELDAEEKKAGADVKRSTLRVFLHRANGDRAKAYQAATSAGLADLREAMLYEAGDWKALHARPDLVNAAVPTRQKGYQAAYARLAGDRAAADKILDALADVYSERYDPLPYAKVMFGNGRVKEGVELLLRTKQHRPVAFEIYVALGQYDKAFALAEAARKANDTGSDVMEVMQGRELYALGEKDKGDAILKGYAGQLERGRVGPWAEELLQAEVQLGRRAEALTVAALILGNSTDNSWPGRVFGKLFPDRTEEAHALWDSLRTADGKRTAEERMTRLDAFLEGKASGKDLAALLAAGKAKAKGMKDAGADRLWWGLGEAAAGCGKVEQAESCLRQSTAPYALVRWGDLAAGGKRWAEAARRYRAAFRRAAGTTVPPKRFGEDAKDFVCALALYLHGHALVQDGRAGEGKKRIEQAHGLLLADGPQNWALAKALTARGHREAATRQYLQMSRLCEPVLHDRGSFYSGEGHRGIALQAMAKTDYLLAADGYERCFLRLVVPTTNFTRGQHYVTSQGFIHLLRSRGLVIAGKLDEAKAAIALARAYQPINPDVGTHLVPLLDKHGRKKEADELYRGIQGELERLLKEYPGSPGLMNRSAWLAATCRREPGKAEKRAREAIKLDPRGAAHHSALAEALFQRGKKDEAVAALRTAMKLGPKNKFFGRQLKRLLAGDPKAVVPIEE